MIKLTPKNVIKERQRANRVHDMKYVKRIYNQILEGETEFLVNVLEPMIPLLKKRGFEFNIINTIRYTIPTDYYKIILNDNKKEKK